MKKTIQCKPEIEVTKLNLENLMELSGQFGGEHGVDDGGFDDGTHEGDAKGFWDDEEDY